MYQRILPSSTKNFIMLVCDNDIDKVELLDLETNQNADIEEWINRKSIDSVHQLDDIHEAKLLSLA